MGGYYRTFLLLIFFGNFHLDSMKNLLIRSVTLFSSPKSWWKKFRKKIFWMAVMRPPINKITMVKMSSYTPFRPIFAKLGTFIHFVVKSNQEKIWVDSDIFVRVMMSSILKCGSGPS